MKDILAACGALVILAGAAGAEQAQDLRPNGMAAGPAVEARRDDGARTVVTHTAPPNDYVIGPDDVLSVVFWRDKDLSADVVVRPDGKISLPLLNDLTAAGSTPDQLRQTVTEEARRFVEDPTVTVIVKQINSRRVFITGQIEKPGLYPLTAPTTVIQLIALAGGLKEFAESKRIVIMRTEEGRQVGYPFNYQHVVERRNLKQNIPLKPGDTVIVP